MKEYLQRQKEEGKSIEEARNNLANEFNLSLTEAGEIVQRFITNEL